MKLIVLVLANAQADTVVDALLQKGQRVTRMATTGGLLRQGNTTLIVGTAEEKVQEILEVVERQAPGALAIVLPLERYERF